MACALFSLRDNVDDQIQICVYRHNHSSILPTKHSPNSFSPSPTIIEQQEQEGESPSSFSSFSFPSPTVIEQQEQEGKSPSSFSLRGTLGGNDNTTTTGKEEIVVQSELGWLLLLLPVLCVFVWYIRVRRSSAYVVDSKMVHVKFVKDNPNTESTTIRQDIRPEKKDNPNTESSTTIRQDIIRRPEKKDNVE